MTDNNPEAQYYQAVVADLTSSNERLTEKNAERKKHIERLRVELHELRTLLSVCALFVAAVEGRGLLDENDLYQDMSQRLNHYFASKEMPQ